MRKASVRALITASALVAVCGGAGVVERAFAQPLDTGFTYQGELAASGVPANGTYDLRFRLYTTASGGTQVGATLCSDNVAVVNGKFSVALDFGAQFAGQQRFLEIDVRVDSGLGCGNATGFTTLAPRQNLKAAPNAVYSMNAGAAQTATSATTATTATTATNATQLNGQAASFYQNAANLTAGAIPDGRLAGTYTSAVTFSNAANAISGSGAGLTGVNAAQLGGQLPAAYGRLATAQAWTAANTFGNAGNSFTGTFSGTGSGLTGVNAAQLGGQLPGAFGLLAATQAWAGANTFGNASNSFTGSGAGLTGVNAAQLGGQLPAAYGRLATAQAWTAANTFGNAANSFTGTFTGTGSGLTGVNAAQLGGQLPAAFGRIAGTQTWSGINDFNNPGNFFEGTFIGNGASVTNVNAVQLGGLTSAAFGQLNGNQLWIGANSFASGANSFSGLGVGLTNVNAALLNGLHSSQFLREVPNPLILTGSPDVDQSVAWFYNQSGTLNSSAMYAELTGPAQTGATAINAFANVTGANQSYAIYGFHIGTGAAVYGKGTQAASTGVRGEGNQGIGVHAISSNGKALRVDGRSQFNANVEFASGVNLSLGAGANAGFPIQLDNSLGEKISLFGTNQFNHYGFGIQGGTLQIFTDAPASGVAIGSGGSSTFVETIRFVGSEIQFHLDNVDAITKIDAPYDMTFGMDRNSNNNNSWYRFYTNGRLFEQFRIADDDEAPAFFDGPVNANGIDYAEAFKVLDPAIEAGDVIVVGGEGGWEYASRSASAYDPEVIGVVSTRPAFVAGMSFDAEDRMDPELTRRRDAARAAGDDALEKQLTMQMRALVERAYRPVAFVGRVPVKVTGPVNVGDHLAASAVPGRAMAMGKAGQSIGVALEASAGGDGKVLVLIQPKYFVPAVVTDDPATLDAVTAQLDRVLAENEALKARLDRLEAAVRK